MIASTASLDPAKFVDLNVSNHLLGDKAGLAAAWSRDGYWFFRDVLDRAAVTRFRDAYIAELSRQGVVDPGDPLARYNGRPFDAGAFRKKLRGSEAWRDFVEFPAIHALFRSLLDDEPYWVPNIVNRGTPPDGTREKERLLFIHQDGAFNRGIPFFVTWVPLAEISADMGGVALVEGVHKGPILHPVRDEVYSGIDAATLPPDRWRRSDYRPGDLLMMDVMTPHTGLTNISDRFRFSVDLRVMRASENVPAVGTLIEIDQDHLTVRSEEEGDVRLVLDEQTYCRGLDGKRLKPPEIPTMFPVGSAVLVARVDGRAMMMRPPH